MVDIPTCRTCDRVLTFSSSRCFRAQLRESCCLGRKVGVYELMGQTHADPELIRDLAVTPPPPAVSLHPLDVAVLLGILAVEGALIVAGLWR